MNTGIGDAINLAWKLKAALDERAPDALLDSYEAERIAFARRLVRTTDQAFTLVAAEARSPISSGCGSPRPRSRAPSCSERRESSPSGRCRRSISTTGAAR